VAVGAAQVARFPGKVALAEGDFDLVIEGVLGADMGALGIGVGTDGAEALESGQNALWGSEDGDRVRGKASAGSVAGFELAAEDEGWVGELLFWQAEAGAVEDFGPAGAMSTSTPLTGILFRNAI
jgi:hypothetical protein